MSATLLLDEIAALVRVVEAGTFAAAARQLGVPKSTLTRAVTRLEAATKVRLLVRSARLATLTEPGRAFYDQVAPHIAGLRDATAALDDLGDQPHGTLRITASADIGEALADVLVRFGARYPKIRLDVDLSGRVVSLVDEGFDVALRATSRLRDDSTTVARTLGPTEIHYFASPGYLARRGTPQTPDDLARHDCVLFRAGSAEVEWPMRGPGGEQKTVVVTGRVGGSEFPLLRAALRAGAGIGPLPTFVAAQDVAAGRLVRVLPDWCRPAGTLYLLYQASRHVPRKVAAFRDFLVESVRKPDGSLAF